MTSKTTYVVATIFGLVFAGASLIWFGVAIAGGVPFAFCGGFMFLAFGGAAAFWGIKNLLAFSAFQQVHLECLRPVPLGGMAELQLVLSPKRALALNPAGCRATVKTIEKAHYSAGTRSRTYTETLYTQEVELRLPQALNQHFEQRFVVPIPRTIPPSWSGKYNWFITSVSVHVDIDKWPDLDLEAAVTVLPEVARG